MAYTQIHTCSIYTHEYTRNTNKYPKRDTYLCSDVYLCHSFLSFSSFLYLLPLWWSKTLFLYLYLVILLVCLMTQRYIGRINLNSLLKTANHNFCFPQSSICFKHFSSKCYTEVFTATAPNNL